MNCRPSRQAAVGDVAEDVHQDTTDAHHQQHDQGGQETLDEITQEIAIELRHGAVV